MSGRGINLDVDLSICAIVSFALDVVAARHIGVEVESFDVAHAVVVIVTAVLMPLALKVPRGKRNLVVRSADYGSIRNPVAIFGEEVGATADGVSAVW